MDEKDMVWEKKDRRMAWMNINTACSTILAARIQAGIITPKNKEDTIKELLDMIRIEYAEYLTIDIEPTPHPKIEPERIQKQTDQNTLDKQPDQPGSRDATEKMKKTIWGIVYGKDGQPDLEETELKPKGLDRFTVTKKYIDFDWASEFIDRHKKTEF